MYILILASSLTENILNFHSSEDKIFKRSKLVPITPKTTWCCFKTNSVQLKQMFIEHNRQLHPEELQLGHKRQSSHGAEKNNYKATKGRAVIEEGFLHFLTFFLTQICFSYNTLDRKSIRHKYDLHVTTQNFPSKRT